MPRFLAKPLPADHKSYPKALPKGRFALTLQNASCTRETESKLSFRSFALPLQNASCARETESKLSFRSFALHLHNVMDIKLDSRPRVAIVDPNTPAALGMKALLEEVVPIVEADTFGSFAELSANEPERYFHYFVSLNTLLENRSYFAARRHKTIVLAASADAGAQPAGFHCVCTCVPERQLAKQLLALEQSAHADGRHLPPMQRRHGPTLTEREAEVLALIVRGLINKEIAERLGIGLATVITHRKNIMEKLGARSVSALTIYAVMNGYVDMNSI